ncbi:ATP-dependent Zn protease [Arenicella chitinivorans]|uniref:ATP-dependent Zn protease n=2 Tax=Arenicella chitinivorans TaxID=1329800 RepID=A0A918RHD2_9GAMM|nr:ATP-dependent Zn protease [Arenicella chitinivorans]
MTRHDELKQRLESMEASLAGKFEASCDARLAELGTQIKQFEKVKETTKVVERCTTAKPVAVAAGSTKLILGEVEKITLAKESMTLTARVDTGADTSSLGVYHLQPFERNGDDWIRFSLNKKKDAETIEYPVFDQVRVKASNSITEERYEIKLDIRVGGQVYRKQLFNLSDRTNLDYQVLLGRSFLRDIAVVDVSQKMLLGGK